jgi:hypothetical protein
MVSHELIEGVKKMLESGASEHVIVELLESRGWTKEDALTALSLIEKEKAETGGVFSPFGANKTASHASSIRSDESHDSQSPQNRSAPTVHGTHSNLPGPLSLTASALSRVREKFATLFVLSFIASVVYAVLYVLGVHVFTHDFFSRLWENAVAVESARVTTLPILALTIVFAGMITFGIISWFIASSILVLSGRAVTTRDALIRGIKGGTRFFVSSTMSLLVFAGGLLFFIIPGLVIGAWSVFAPLIAAREQTTPFQSLLVSRELVRRNVWDVVGREFFLVVPTVFFILLLYSLFYLLFFLTSPGLGVNAILFLVVAFIIPLLFSVFVLFVCAYQVVLYEALRARITNVVTSKRFAMLLSSLLLILFAASLIIAFIAASHRT